MRIQVERWEYEIDDNNVISAWYLDNLNSDVEGCPPNLRQENHPNGEPFASREDAQVWVETHIKTWTTAVAAAEVATTEPEAAE